MSSETRNQRAFRDGFLVAAEAVMHFINALDSSDMDANAVRSAIYHKCLEMRPPVTSPHPEGTDQ